VKNFYCIFVIFIYGPEAKVERERGGYIIVVEIEARWEWGTQKIFCMSSHCILHFILLDFLDFSLFIVFLRRYGRFSVRIMCGYNGFNVFVCREQRCYYLVLATHQSIQLFLLLETSSETFVSIDGFCHVFFLIAIGISTIVTAMMRSHFFFVVAAAAAALHDFLAL
jgi:hypothetical protein